MNYNQELHEKIRQARLRIVSDPSRISEGDIVILDGGKRMRIGHVYDDGTYQLTNSSNFFCQRGEEFLGKPILGLVHLSSGGLDSSVDSELEYLGIEDAPCWTWRETPCANGGIDIEMPFRVFRIKNQNNN